MNLKKIQSMTSDDVDFKKQILSLKNMPLSSQRLSI